MDIAWGDDVTYPDIGFLNYSSQSRVAELLPGRHRICVSFATSLKKIRSQGCRALDLELLEGHVYEVYAIFYTHKWDWIPAVWDITDELSRPERARFSSYVVAALNKHRDPSEQLFPAAYPATPAPPSLRGSGEELQATLALPPNRPVQLTYAFDRYRPFVVAKGNAGRQYHIQISPQTGELVRAFGTRLTVGNFFAEGITGNGFQPLGSEFVLVLDLETNRPRLVYREGPPGKYTKVAEWKEQDLPVVP